jgi:alcohol dehydrogenase
MVNIRSVTVDAPNGALAVTEGPRPEPGYGQVRLAVDACGMCHSDAALVEGHRQGVTFPLTPGHEIAGRVDAVGERVRGWAEGDRVAVGWYGGYCTSCHACRRGDFVRCANVQIPGLSYPGGYSDAVIVPATALARIPAGMSAEQAGPMACAGVTTYAALRSGHARPGDLVAVLGLGGLGHLGVQFAAKMGFDTVVVARGRGKAEPAASLGARHYIDATTGNVAGQLQGLGGARVILATASSAQAVQETFDGLTPNGELIVLGFTADPLSIPVRPFIVQARTVRGHAAGTPADIEDTMAFAQLTGVRAMTETLPLTEAAKGYERMTANEARFRVVLTM